MVAARTIAWHCAGKRGRTSAQVPLAAHPGRLREDRRQEPNKLKADADLKANATLKADAEADDAPLWPPQRLLFASSSYPPSSSWRRDCIVHVRGASQVNWSS